MNYSLELITEESLCKLPEFLHSLVCIAIASARPDQRLSRYLRSKLLLQVKDFDQNLHKYYGQLTAVDFHKSHLVKNQID